jgi:hypothetical protein
LKNIEKEVNHPYFGEVKYDDKGLPLCHICGKSFRKLLNHVWQKHGIYEKEYKLTFGLDTGKGICCQETRERLQQAIKDNYDIVVSDNLLKNGSRTRFKSGGMGRTRDKLSEQSRRRLSDLGRTIIHKNHKYKKKN